MQGLVVWALYRVPYKKATRIEGPLRDTAALGTPKTTCLQHDTLSGPEQPLPAYVRNG